MIPLLMHKRQARAGEVGLFPSDQLADEDMQRIPFGKDVAVETKQPRSLPHHRLLFGLLRKVAQATPTPLSEEALLSWVKVRTGHVEHLPLGFGKSYEAPASISWASMGQAEFRQFFDQVAHLICTEVLPGLDQAALTAEVEAMLADKRSAA